MENLKEIINRVRVPRDPSYVPEETSEVCPACKGHRLVVHNVRYGHPDFGKVYPCVCHQEAAPGSTLDTFNFLPNYSDVKLAYEATVNWCAKRGPSILVLNGPRGVGKTHLAQAALREIMRVDPNARTRWMPDGQLSDTIRDSYENDSWNEWKAEFKNCHWLIIDDLGSVQLSDHMKSRYGEIIDWRWQGAANPEIRTMITTNAKADMLGSRVESRLKDVSRTRSVTIEAPDYRLTKGG